STSVPRKMAVLGDEGCGKTSFLAFAGVGRVADPPKQYCNVIDYVVNGKKVSFTVFDGDFDEDFPNLRLLECSLADVLLICFSIDCPNFLTNIKSRCGRYAARLKDGVPIILVGLKADLRKDDTSEAKLSQQAQMLVQFNDGLAAAHEIGAKSYLECSSVTGQGVREVLETAAILSLEKRKTHSCFIL
ncbi:uncharacterized protein TRIVIDRAFT_37243, partial [Trichoderma virens Gv29-8]